MSLRQMHFVVEDTTAHRKPPEEIHQNQSSVNVLGSSVSCHAP
jgi:hypothetical protein